MNRLPTGGTRRTGPESPPFAPLPTAAQLINSITLPADKWFSYGICSGASERQRLVIRNQSEWESFWSVAASRLIPAPPAPEVNFTKNMVVVATMGGRPNGGYSISILGIYRKGQKLYVPVLEVAPEYGCVVTTAVTAPFTALLTPQSDDVVEFLEATSVFACECRDPGLGQ